MPVVADQSLVQERRPSDTVRQRSPQRAALLTRACVQSGAARVPSLDVSDTSSGQAESLAGSPRRPDDPAPLSPRQATMDGAGSKSPRRPEDASIGAPSSSSSSSSSGNLGASGRLSPRQDSGSGSRSPRKPEDATLGASSREMSASTGLGKLSPRRNVVTMLLGKVGGVRRTRPCLLRSPRPDAATNR